MPRHPHTIIIGAGIIGLSTAYALLSRGERQSRVTVLEQATVDHERSTSHGFSRLLRFEYGADAFYTRMVRLSLERWQQLEQASGRELYIRTGVLSLGRHDDHCTRASYALARSTGLPVEQLTAAECRRRFPQFNLAAYEIFQYNAEGGILRASYCLQTLRDRIRDLGGKIYERCQVNFLEHEELSKPVQVRLRSGEIIEADRVVVATGPWIHGLLPDLKLPVQVTRQYLLYFSGLAPGAFGAGRFPAFLADQLYGFPIHQGCNGWVKAASHELGMRVSPGDSTTPNQAVLAHIRDQLCTLLPALRCAQLARIDSCMYDMSPDGDFILDRLPDDPRVIVASGLSGHGFKFGLLLGEVLGSMVRQDQPVIPVERFRLNRFTAPLQSALSAASSALPPGVSR
jgi:monomeric sarcosine oxidase